jgi:HD superfamily phosphohydrolase
MARVFHDGNLYTRDGRTKIALTESEKEYHTRLAMIAALLHDLGHGPLSHALDLHIGLRGPTQTIKPDRHYSIEYISRYLRPAITGAGVSPDDVIKLIQEERIERLSPWMHFIAGLVDSPLDVDRMDYLARDAHMTGLSVGALNMSGLMERAVPFQEVDPDGTVKIELAFDPSAVPYIEEFLYARDIMYIKCYEHPTKVVAERMLGKAFDEFRNNPEGEPSVPVESLALLTDQEIMQLMLDCCGPETFVYRIISALMRGDAYDLVAEVPIRLIPPVRPGTLKTLPTEIQRWATDAMQEFFEEAYLTIPDQWAQALARRAEGVQESQILVTVPSWSIVGNWNKEGDIRILQKEGQGYTVKYVKEISSTVKDFVRILMQARLKVRVFVDPALDPAQKDSVRQAVEIFFRAPNLNCAGSGWPA